MDQKVLTMQGDWNDKSFLDEKFSSAGNAFEPFSYPDTYEKSSFVAFRSAKCHSVRLALVITLRGAIKCY